MSSVLFATQPFYNLKGKQNYKLGEFVSLQNSYVNPCVMWYLIQPKWNSPVLQTCPSGCHHIVGEVMAATEDHRAGISPPSAWV